MYNAIFVIHPNEKIDSRNKMIQNINLDSMMPSKLKI